MMWTGRRHPRSGKKNIAHRITQTAGMTYSSQPLFQIENAIFLKRVFRRSVIAGFGNNVPTMKVRR
jgi:hypothetical protein